MVFDLILPTYNRARLLEKTLRSVRQAVMPPGLDVRVLVVDNNSTDDTKQVAARYSQQEGVRVEYLFVGRPGKSAALNEAIAASSAELIGMIDDDEELDRRWFEVALREFTADPGLEYIGGPYLPNWEQPPPAWLPLSYNGIIGIVPRPNRVAFTPEFSGMLMGGNTVIRRATLARVLPYPEHLGKIGAKIRSGEDEVIYHRLLALGAKGLVVPDLIIHHWIPAERLTRRYFRKWIVGRGISMGWQMRERGTAEPSLIGIPRYKFGAAARGIAGTVIRRTSQDRFIAQLDVLDCFATLYGRYFH